MELKNKHRALREKPQFFIARKNPNTHEKPKRFSSRQPQEKRRRRRPQISKLSLDRSRTRSDSCVTTSKLRNCAIGRGERSQCPSDEHQSAGPDRRSCLPKKRRSLLLISEDRVLTPFRSRCPPIIKRISRRNDIKIIFSPLLIS